jgi:hypothetical protein
MELVKHILERSFIHLGWAPWAIGLSIYGFWLLGRYKPAWKLPVGPWRWVVPGIVALFITFSREAYDVWQGGWVGKSYIDLLVWAGSMTLAGLGLRWFVRHFDERAD